MIDQARVDRAFDAIVRAALRDERCPENGMGGIAFGTIPELARQGRIRIEISGRNYRRVTILTGPYAGKSTAADPNGHQPWKILDAHGRRRGPASSIGARHGTQEAV